MLLVAFIFLLVSSLSDAIIYKRTGDKVVIPTGSAAVGITSIAWNHNEDKAVEWYGGEPSAFRQFKGCTTLDTKTGALTISGLTQEHSGSYTAVVSDKVAGTTEIQVVSPVPKPTVSKLCDAEMTYCTLTCEGDITDAGPIDYSWSIIDVHNYHKGQQFNLTKDDHDPWFQCVMKNPISSETSEEFLNPFLAGNWTVIIIVSLLVVILILIGLLVGIYIYHKYKSKKDKSPKEDEETQENNNPTENSPKEEEEIPGNNNPSENTELLAVVSNGVVPSLSTEETLAQNLQTSSVVLNIINETTKLNTSEISSPDKTSEKPNDEPDQVLIQTREESPGSSAQTENSPKKEEEIKVQIHRSGTPESYDQTVTTISEGQEALMSAERNNEAAMDSQDQETSRNELQPAASPETENLLRI